MKEARNVLSFSSHVAHGYVGNKAMTFPLQLRGWNIDAINTTNFSNHPGYGHFKGTKTDKAQIREIHEALNEIGVLYDLVLTGYAASAETLEEVIDICIQHKLSRGAVWVLDPVLGDNGKLYVSEALVPIYKSILSSGEPDLVTPNQFEMELLTGVTIDSLETLRLAIVTFHKKYKVCNVVVSSVLIAEKLVCAGSTLGAPELCYFEIPQINAVFSGSGDLFLALLADSFVKQLGIHGQSLESVEAALAETTSVVEAVLQRTYEIEVAQKKHIQGDKPYVPDLKIVESTDIFLQSEVGHKYKGIRINI